MPDTDSMPETAPDHAWFSQAFRDIGAERRQQVEKGFDVEHDDEHDNGDLARAAICYAADGSQKLDCVAWLAPWGGDRFTTEDRRGDLVRAAALLVAEIERIDRAA